MKSLRWVGLVFSLLIVGVVGGLMAPPPSDAVNATTPVIKIEVKQGTSTTGASPNQVNLLYRPATHADSTCPAPTPDGTWGPNYCYKIITPQAFTTPNGYQVQIVDVDAVNQKAQLQISDYQSVPGTSPQDGMKLSGIKIVPVATPTWNADSSVEVKVIITATNKFDAQPNPPATPCLARRLPWTLSTAGYWEALQSALINTSPVGDIFELFGQGTFVTAGTITGTCTVNGVSTPLAVPTTGQPKGLWNNTYDSILDDYNKTADLTVSPNACSAAAGNTSDSKLCFTLAGPGNTRKVTFSGKLSAPYPGSPSSQPQSNPDQRFYCTNNLTGTITVTPPKGANITYTNPTCQPTVTYTNRFTLKGPDITALTGSPAQGGVVCNESGTANQLPQCEGTGNNPNRPTAEQLLTIWSEALINGTLAGLPGVPPGEECTAEVCNGNLILSVKLTPTEPVDETFNFLADGPLVENSPVTVPANSNTSSPQNDVTFTELITGEGKSKIVIQPDYATWPQAPDRSFFQADQVQIESGNGSTNINQADPNADVVVVSSGGIKCGVIIRAIKQDASGNGDTIKLTFHAHNSKKRPVSCNIQ